ncbi:MAG: 2-amino-4-hydroxy-6-hydroxymethyldihydropteridine diphosphokinase [Bacteroidota bacterium]
MAVVYFSIGSNQGDRLNCLVKATQLIDLRIGKVLCFSAVYESAPWGFQADTSFLNQVLQVETELDPHLVLSALLDIEKILGRIRAGLEYSSRIIDIDILFYDELHMEEDILIIPHPRMHLRRFVMEPLASIAPDFLHPILKKPVSELLNILEDTGGISVAVEKNKFRDLLNRTKQS